jgi:hypothetical protein
MEFWCLTKVFNDYEDCYLDCYNMHFKDEQEALDNFNDYIESYKDLYELEEDEYEYFEEEDIKEFNLEFEFCFVKITLEKIRL